LADEVRSLGVSQGDVVMIHTSMRSLGWVIGGADTVVRGLLDAVGAAGTIVAMTGAHNDTWYGFDRWPAALQDLYMNEMPAFDPVISESTPDVGRVPERIRTWPGAVRSDHPESSLVALGPRAAWLMDPHPLDFPSGEGSPLARLVEADGKVLTLGAPLETITLLHHAETMAAAPDKRIVRYPMAVLRDGERTWVTVSDIDSSDGAYEYSKVCKGDAFAVIGQAALEAGVGTSGSVGASTSHLFPARGLVAFAISWIDERFGAS
jgi:aminoglycoside 3-N-acetyltransferase